MCVPRVAYRKKTHTAQMALTHRSCFFLSAVHATKHLVLVFCAQCFHLRLLWCAEIINRLVTLCLPAQKQKPEDTGNVTSHLLQLGSKLYTLSSPCTYFIMIVLKHVPQYTATAEYMRDRLKATMSQVKRPLSLPSQQLIFINSGLLNTKSSLLAEWLWLSSPGQRQRRCRVNAGKMNAWKFCWHLICFFYS